MIQLNKLSVNFTGDFLFHDISFVAGDKDRIGLVGHNGAGKSTLLNTLYGEEIFATQEIQAWSGKGRHTTTSRELVRLPNGALILDTPGIREIGRLDEDDIELVKGESSHRWRVKCQS